MAWRQTGVFMRFARLFNVKLDIGAHNELRVKIPGFSYQDFDRAGYVGLANIFRFIEFERPMNYRYPNVIPFYWDENIIPVMFSQYLTISPELYENARLDFPILMTVRLIDAGKTSYVMKVILEEVATGKPLVSVLRRLVSMDTKTRRPVQIPENIVENIKSLNAFDQTIQPFPVFPKLVLPERHFKSRVQVAHSDMDLLRHTNQATYVRYSMDCASRAAEKGFFGNFSGDMCYYNAMSATTLHINESFAGDELTVCTWEDPENPERLYFIIRKGDVDLFYSKVDFLNESESNVR